MRPTHLRTLAGLREHAQTILKQRAERDPKKPRSEKSFWQKIKSFGKSALGVGKNVLDKLGVKTDDIPKLMLELIPELLALL